MTHTHNIIMYKLSSFFYLQFELFVLDVLWSGLKADSLMSSHPIEVRVSKPEDVNSIFDLISYKKVHD